MEPEHLRLAGITRLTLSGRGPTDAFIFDPHRLAFPAWAVALGELRPALLVTLDRHFDLVPPKDVQSVPDAAEPLRRVDEYARWELDHRNFDHVLAAMEAGLVGDAIVVARNKPRRAIDERTWTDRRGETHRILAAPTIDRLADGFGAAAHSPEAQEAEDLIRNAKTIILDVDLDCFTTVSDADPTDVVPWSREIIRRHVLPPGSEPFWDAVLFKTRVLTIACEPAHCGGFVATHNLFRDATEILFRELLRTDPP